jgi:hypothetical protein
MGACAGILGLVIVAACGSPPRAVTPSPAETVAARTATPQPATGEEAIRQLVLLEGQGVVGQDIEGVMGLWAEDARITDARHTPDDASDDALWQGRDAIRERYIVLVFPGAPAVAGATDISVEITGNAASATSTSVIGAEVAPLGDRWTFERRAGRWWITSLTYNLEDAEH